MATSWTASSSYTGVTVSASVDNTSGVIAQAWLTTQIGPGATSAQQIATTTVPPVSGNDTLFTGLSLGPGTYYLVLMFNSGMSIADWQIQDSASPIVTDAGVTIGPSLVGPFQSFPSYGPSASFSSLGSSDLGDNNGDKFMFSVTEGSGAVPEPASVFLLGPALGFLFLARKGLARRVW